MNNIRADLQQIYRDTVLEHSREPHHFGRPASCNHEAQGFNPLCGDKLTIYLQVDDNMIKNAAFEGAGCAISIASASMLMDSLQGQPLDIARIRIAEVQRMLNNDTDSVSDELNDLRSLQGVRRYPSRIKCATLAWHTAEAALEQNTQPVSTEQDY